jgi:hypothetical protein
MQVEIFSTLGGQPTRLKTHRLSHIRNILMGMQCTRSERTCRARPESKPGLSHTNEKRSLRDLWEIFEGFFMGFLKVF